MGFNGVVSNSPPQQTLASNATGLPRLAILASAGGRATLQLSGRNSINISMALSTVALPASVTAVVRAGGPGAGDVLQLGISSGAQIQFSLLDPAVTAGPTGVVRLATPDGVVTQGLFRHCLRTSRHALVSAKLTETLLENAIHVANLIRSYISPCGVHIIGFHQNAFKNVGDQYFFANLTVAVAVIIITMRPFRRAELNGAHGS